MGGNGARLVWPALVVLALVGVVAVAATGSTEKGTSAVRPPSATLLDTILSLGAVAWVAGAVLLAYGLTQRKAIAEEMAAKRYRRQRFATFVVVMTAFTAFAYFRLRNWEVEPVDDELADPLLPGGAPIPSTPDAEATVTYEPRFAWLPVIVVVALAVAAILAYVVAQRRASRAARGEDALLEKLATALDETLDDLRAETDPRLAVIAAYARLERVLAAHGVARRAAETPEEYLRRVLGNLAIRGAAVRRLTDLFSRAKFSQHAVDIGMKEEAIDALEQVRDELRESAKRPEQAGREELSPTGASS